MPLLISLLSGLLGNEFGRLGLVAAIVGLAGWHLGFNAVPKVDVPAIIRNTTEARDAEWDRKLTEANKAHEANLALAVEAAQAVAATPVDKTEASILCAKDKLCRK